MFVPYNIRYNRGARQHNEILDTCTCIRVVVLDDYGTVASKIAHEMIKNERNACAKQYRGKSIPIFLNKFEFSCRYYLKYQV